MTAETLGAYYAQPGVRERIEARREEARRRMRLAFADTAARLRALPRLVDAHEATRLGRRLDLVATDLRCIADDLDAVVQPLDAYQRRPILEMAA